jgi:hypothetical protein
MANFKPRRSAEGRLSRLPPSHTPDPALFPLSLKNVTRLTRFMVRDERTLILRAFLRDKVSIPQ